MILIGIFFRYGWYSDQTNSLVLSNREKFIWNAPTYSEALLSIFGPETCDSCMYIANFSEPYKGMIRCDILPKDKMVGIYGSPVISAFLFKYNNRGEIYQSYKAEVNID